MFIIFFQVFFLFLAPHFKNHLKRFFVQDACNLKRPLRASNHFSWIITHFTVMFLSKLEQISRPKSVSLTKICLKWPRKRFLFFRLNLVLARQRFLLFFFEFWWNRLSFVKKCQKFSSNCALCVWELPSCRWP